MTQRSTADSAASATGDKFDVVVVGGGIGGVCTAICLAESGQRVLLLEKDLLGSGASGSTVFQVHSGAKYSLDRPELARALSVAAPLWRELPIEGLTDTEVEQKQTWLMTSRGHVFSKLQYALRLVGIPCMPVSTEELSTVLAKKRLQSNSRSESQSLQFRPSVPCNSWHSAASTYRRS